MLNTVPSYRRHKRTGRAIVTVRDHLGSRRDILLLGAYGSAESRWEYDRIKATVTANNGRMPATRSGTGDLTVNELVLRYMDDHAAGYYVDPAAKEPSSEQHCLALAFRPLTRLFGDLPVGEFDSLKLEALQSAMASGCWMTAKERKHHEKQKRPIGCARSTVNRHVDRVKRLFRWGCAKKLVLAS
jgi:hypothetical protein